MDTPHVTELSDKYLMRTYRRAPVAFVSGQGARLVDAEGTTYLDFVERRGGAYVALMRGGIGSDPEVAAVLEEVRLAFLGRIVADLPPGVEGPLVRTAGL